MKLLLSSLWLLGLMAREARACDANYVGLTVVLTTDQYPQETGWTVTTPAGDIVMQHVAGTTLARSSEVSTGPLCVLAGSVFTITDAYNDGICCGYGEGGYILDVEFGDPSSIASNGDFGRSESHTLYRPRYTGPVAPLHCPLLPRVVWHRRVGPQPFYLCRRTPTPHKRSGRGGSARCLACHQSPF